MDVGHDATGRDGGGADELVELLVVLDGELDVARDDAGLLVVLGGVATELNELGGQVLEDGSHVDGSASSDTLGVAALLQVRRDAAHRELQTSTLAACLLVSALHLATSGSALTSLSAHPATPHASGNPTTAAPHTLYATPTALHTRTAVHMPLLHHINTTHYVFHCISFKIWLMCNIN